MRAKRAIEIKLTKEEHLATSHLKQFNESADETFRETALRNYNKVMERVWTYRWVLKDSQTGRRTKNGKKKIKA